MTKGLGKVPKGLGKVSDGLGKVSNGLGKVSDGLGKVSDGLGMVSDGVWKVSDGAEMSSDSRQSLDHKYSFYFFSLDTRFDVETVIFKVMIPNNCFVALSRDAPERKQKL